MLERRSTVRQQSLLWAGAVARQTDGRLPKRVVFGTIAGEKHPEKRRPGKLWLECVTKTLEAFGATDGSKEGGWRVFGIDSSMWTITAKKGDGQARGGAKGS